MATVEQIRERIPDEAQERVNKAVETFRENHKDPANLALHAAGYYAILKGVVRVLFRRKRFRGLAFIAAGVGLILIGHEIEGTEPFTLLKGSSSGA